MHIKHLVQGLAHNRHATNVAIINQHLLHCLAAGGHSVNNQSMNELNEHFLSTKRLNLIKFWVPNWSMKSKNRETLSLPLFLLSLGARRSAWLIAETDKLSLTKFSNKGRSKQKKNPLRQLSSLCFQESQFAIVRTSSVPQNLLSKYTLPSIFHCVDAL